MSKKVIKVQFIKENTQIGTKSIPEAVIDPTRRNYGDHKVSMSYDPSVGVVIRFEGTPYSQFIPNHNIAAILLEDDDAKSPSTAG